MKTTEEATARRELTNTLENLVERWELFAETYHGKQYADPEHAFGVLFSEYGECNSEMKKVTDLIFKFLDDCILQHDLGGAYGILDEIHRYACFAAEEAAQIAAVALKAKGSDWMMGGTNEQRE